MANFAQSDHTAVSRRPMNWGPCYDFGNILAENTGKNIGTFD
jgi:hypothetical protein